MNLICGFTGGACSRSIDLYSTIRITKKADYLQMVFCEFKFDSILNTKYEIMVHKIEDCYFETEYFLVRF